MSAKFGILMIMSVFFIATGSELVLAGEGLKDAKGNGAFACYGSPEAQLQVIYLHGFDTPRPGPEELRSRVALREWAKTGTVRVALPRSNQSCKVQSQNKDLLCWPAKEPTQAQTSLDAAVSQSGQCLLKGKPALILGFSNGGWLVNKLHRWCLVPKDQQLAAAGAAGMLDEHSPKSLRDCGRLYQLIGQEDVYNKDAASKFVEAAKARQGRVQTISYVGGHYLTIEALKQLSHQIAEASEAKEKAGK